MINIIISIYLILLVMPIPLFLFLFFINNILGFLEPLSTKAENFLVRKKYKTEDKQNE